MQLFRANWKFQYIFPPPAVEEATPSTTPKNRIAQSYFLAMLFIPSQVVKSKAF